MHKNIVAAPQLAEHGKQKIEWVKRNMPILQQIEDDFREKQYFSGLRFSLPDEYRPKPANH